MTSLSMERKNTTNQPTNIIENLYLFKFTNPAQVMITGIMVFQLYWSTIFTFWPVQSKFYKLSTTTW